MKKKKILVFTLGILCILAVIIIFLNLLGQKEGNLLSTAGGTEDFLTARNRTFFACDKGYYFMGSNRILRFLDFETKEIIIVCNKANCKHVPWEDLTPEEERCDAFIACCNSVFVYNNKLYIIQQAGNLSLSMYQSELDRSNQSLVADFGVNLLARFYVKNNKMYYSNVIPEETVDEAGFPTTTGRQTNYISMLDLKTKKITRLTEPRTGYISSMYFLSMQGNKIYYRYDYFENALKPDNSNWEETKLHMEFYSFDVDSKETLTEFESVKPKDLIVLQYIIDHKLFYATLGRESSTEQNPDTLYCCDGDTNKTSLLLSGIYGSIIYDNKVFYSLTKGDEYDPYYYDLITGQTVELCKENNKRYVIIDESGEGFLISVAYSQAPEGRSSSLCYITKEDYYNGDFNFVKLD